jgi:hypothetical protein
MELDKHNELNEEVVRKNLDHTRQLDKPNERGKAVDRRRVIEASFIGL